MKSINIDIAAIISVDLKSRSVVKDFDLYIHNLNTQIVTIDFTNVKFATRSFIDEFYNTFLKQNSNTVKVKLKNVSPDLQTLFKAVEFTQNKPKNKTNADSVIYLESISEMKNFFSSLAL